MYQEPTIAGILRHLAAEYDGPVEERRVLERVLERRPSSAKNPFATIRERLRWDGLALGWLRLDRRRLMPLRAALQGLRFRCVPRACDVAAGLLPLAHLQPFAGLRGATLSLRDQRGAALPLIDPAEPDEEADLATPSFDLSAWYRRAGFVAGDSILVTVDGAESMDLTIEREPAAELRRAEVAAQDAELIEAIVARVGRSQLVLIPCDEVVLPIFATAPWRTAYPGSPWQHLVTRDSRLQLVDDIFLTNQRHPSLRLFSSDEIFEPAPESEPDRAASEAALLVEIEALQRELRHTREQDADAGLWNGQIQRASAAHNTIDRFADDLRNSGRPGSVDRFPRDPDEAGWEAESWDVGDLFEPDELISDDPVAVADAQSRLLAALPPEAVERLKHARPEEAEVIIAQHLNMLLVRAPDLFPRIELDLSTATDQLSDPALQPSAEEAWQNAWDDDDDDEWVADLDEDLSLSDEAGSFARSGELIARFHDYLAEMGKSAATARARARALRIYAEFLSAYYERTLAEGDYATLDECLFFYYPRRVMNTSPRQVRELCTAIKQFYNFLQAHGELADDRFAQAIWRRRDQAARVLQLYDRIAGDSPGFERLFERLFWPYTT